LIKSGSKLYVYECVCVTACMSDYLYVCSMFECMWLWLCLCLCVYKCLCACLCVCVCVLICMYASMCAYTWTYKHIRHKCHLHKMAFFNQKSQNNAFKLANFLPLLALSHVYMPCWTHK
jgi:hypothetical protein